MKKVMVVFGTRPEAIKMAPVVKELKKHSEIDTIVCVTAQHRSMLDQVLDAFKIVPDYDLDVMEASQTLSLITTKVMNGMEEILKKERPDILLVHGDTTTAMASALAAFYQRIRVGHVEAGLRTYDKYSPFPEEINRQIIDAVADRLYAPTEKSKENLGTKLNKGQEILVTGNTAIDALKTTVTDEYTDDVLEWVGDSRLILVTAHRRENLGTPMESIFMAIRRIVEAYSDVKVIYPVHLNPAVQKTAKDILGKNDRIRLIAPLDVLGFHNYMKRAYFIMTDSGGVQEEAPSLGKPVLVLRDTTERPEGIEAGTLKLVGTNQETIFEEASQLLSDRKRYLEMSNAKNPYGDGTASAQIVKDLIQA